MRGDSVEQSNRTGARHDAATPAPQVCPHPPDLVELVPVPPPPARLSDCAPGADRLRSVILLRFITLLRYLFGDEMCHHCSYE
jgi:hypothetical protein